MRKVFLATAAALAVVVALPKQATAVVTGLWAAAGDHAGTVKLGWSNRGGSCDVKYTEAGQQTYKYATVTNCDSAVLEVGHLTPGVKYKFVVSNDDHVWSAPVYAWAAGSNHVAMAAPVAPQEVKVETRTVAEELPTNNFKAESYRPCYEQGSMQTAGALNHDERRTGKCGTGVTNVRTVAGPMSGEITVYWTPSEASDGQYHLIYGTQSGAYSMGALNVGGGSNSFTVRALTPGQRYYFKLVPVRQGQPQGYSYEVSDVAR